jgi:serine/threonine-protein kinase
MRGRTLALLANLCASGVVACAPDNPDSVNANAGAGVGPTNGGALVTGGNGANGGTANGGGATNGGSNIAGTLNGGSNANGGNAVAIGGAGGTTGAAGTSGSAAVAGSGGAAPTGMVPFPSSAPFYQDISKAKLDSQSEALIGALDAIGWGDSNKRTELGIDFSFNINLAEPSCPRRAFTKSADFYSPDCDIAPVPVPTGGKGEGVDDYACAGGDDCHLFVYQSTRLYELYHSNISGGQPGGGTFTATCLVVWDLTKDYWVAKPPPDYSRGDGCTGADAAGLPMTPLVITKPDIASGAIKHALRFTIDNNRIASSVYVHPATHLGGPTGGTNMLPYGARLRLRADYPLASLPSDHARTVAKALQTYGMYLADGGNIYISATSDASDLINNSILTALKPRDFEMVDGGARIDADSQDCPHVPLTQ